MLPMRIERLTLKYFRGSCSPVTFEFASNKNIALVFGENGAGKSTIADALDFVCNGEFGSLRERSGTTPRTHIASVGAAPSDVEVELVCGGQTWRAFLQDGKPQTQPAGAPPAFILRRAAITRVMEATPSDRYKALQAFITVPKVERAEGELRRAFKEVNDEVSRAVAARQLAEDALMRFWQAEGCPGKSPIDWAMQQIEKELQRLSSLKARREQSLHAIQTVDQARSVFDTARRYLRQHADAFVLTYQNAPPALAAPLADLAAVLSSPNGTTVKQITGAIGAALAYRTILETALAADQKTLNQLNALKSHLQVLTSSEAELRDRQQLSLRLGRMLEVVERERKRYVSDLMDGIAESAATLYARIHPDEPLGHPSFRVKVQTAGSLELKANFADQTGIPPGAYYSESHLDTLGLCVYLALAKHAGAGNALVVMDDVLTSVDDVHLDRIIALLVDEAPNFGHVIITTHLRAWYDRMRSATGMQADLIELHGWDLERGIRHSHNPSYLQSGAQ